MLRAIFYARFHPEGGPSVVHQYPPASIIAGNNELTLINFSELVGYVIPPYEVCNGRLSILSADRGYRILGMPISVESAKYSRNRFTFNVCFVLDADADVRPWERIVRKTAAFFRDVEECCGLLQTEELMPGLIWAGDDGYPADVGLVYPLLHTMMDDLNLYGETSIAIDRDAVHVINLCLVPPPCPATRIKAWQVPLVIRPWTSSQQRTCDPTLERLHSHIDGVQSVQRIAERADVELKLVKKALRELHRHRRILLVDMVHSQAIYILTNTFAWFAHDETMLEECSSYIATSTPSPSQATIINLYRQLGPGLSVQDLCLNYAHELTGIDVRRFIVFGVLKGFLKRQHKFVLSVESQPTTPGHSNSGSVPNRTPPTTLSPEKAWKTAALSSGWPNPQLTDASPATNGSAMGHSNGTPDALGTFLDGKHCMDEICLAMHMGEKKVVELLRSGKYGEVLFVYR